MLTHPGSVLVPVADSSHVGEARRWANTLAERAGLGSAGRGNVSILVTELATNLVRHAGGGEIVLNRLSDPSGLELLSLDKGPGLPDLDRCMRDGFSTAGGAGTGLGAISRLSHRLEFYSQPDSGTAILARMWAKVPDGEAPSIRTATLNVPKLGEVQCGDAVAMRALGGSLVLMLADGLGHGPLAAESAREAARVFHEQPDVPYDLTGFLSRAHGALRKTRGAAVAVAELNPVGRQVRYAGTGNIVGTLVPPDGRIQHMISHNGTLGLQVHRLAEFQYAWDKGNVMVMHSDGLGTSWSLDKYPGLAARDPAIIAGVLFRDYRRTRDDVTVVVVKESA